MSVELLARLSSYPKMLAVLNTLSPKVLSLSTGRPPEAVELQTVQLNKVSSRFTRAYCLNDGHPGLRGEKATASHYLACFDFDKHGH